MSYVSMGRGRITNEMYSCQKLPTYAFACDYMPRRMAGETVIIDTDRGRLLVKEYGFGCRDTRLCPC